MRESNKEIIKLTDFKLQLKKQIRTPFADVLKPFGTTNYDQQFQYVSFLLKDFHPFSWELKISKRKSFLKYSINKIKNLLDDNSTKQLPLRLYNLETKEVINNKEISNLNNYLILSYC